MNGRLTDRCKMPIAGPAERVVEDHQPHAHAIGFVLYEWLSHIMQSNWHGMRVVHDMAAPSGAAAACSPAVKSSVASNPWASASLPPPANGDICSCVVCAGRNRWCTDGMLCIFRYTTHACRLMHTHEYPPSSSGRRCRKSDLHTAAGRSAGGRPPAVHDDTWDLLACACEWTDGYVHCCTDMDG